MTLKLSKRSDIPSFRALANLASVNLRVQAGEDIKRLEAGQPCFGLPDSVLAYTRERLQMDKMQGYTDSQGMQLLRARIARHIQDEYACEVDYNRIILTMGSSGGLIMTFLAAFDAGDKVGVCTPTYAAYRNMLLAMNIDVVEIPTTDETNYQPTRELLDQYGEGLEGLIICSPSNPTGTIINEDALKDVCAWCNEKGVRLVSDEAYHRISYEEPAQTALKYSDTAIISNTFSKYFAMTGWRLGWLVVPEDMRARFKSLAESLFVAPPTISQQAAYKAFDHLEDFDKYVSYYRINRDVLLESLPKAGLDKLSMAQGAFYLYADISGFTDNSEEFCARMTDEAGVSCTAGLDFDPTRGSTTMRMSYAGATEDMKEACERLKAWLK